MHRSPALAVLLLTACSAERAVSPPEAPKRNTVLEDLAAAVVDPVQQLEIPTYDGTGENVHPDILSFQQPWKGWQCWMMFTPYKGSNTQLENPSVVVSNDCIHWQEPEGIKNPIVDARGTANYNSDPDHGYDALRNEIVTLHRVVAFDSNRIMISTTGDGRSRTRPHVAFAEANHHAVSPALVISADRVGRIWYVDAGTGCVTDSSSVKLRIAKPGPKQSFRDATWSKPEAVSLSQPGYVIWHLDVMALPGGKGFLALYVAFPRATLGSRCSNDDEFLAWSADGSIWQSFNVPILWRGMEGLGLASLYRGTMAYDRDKELLQIWFSGLDKQMSWWSYYTSYNYPALRRALENAPKGALEDLLGPSFNPAPDPRAGRIAMP